MLSVTIPLNGIDNTVKEASRRSFAGASARPQASWMGAMADREYVPRSDVLESKDRIVVRLELPGLNPEDFEVTLHRDVLTVKAERKAPEAPEGHVYHRSELVYGTFTRAFELPASVDRDRIDAAYVSGMLTVTLPKVEEQLPRSIAVKVA